MKFSELLESGKEIWFEDIPVGRYFLYKFGNKYELLEKMKDEYKDLFSDEEGEYYGKPYFSFVNTKLTYNFNRKCILMFTSVLNDYIRSRKHCRLFSYGITSKFEALIDDPEIYSKDCINELLVKAKEIIEKGISIMDDISPYDLQKAMEFVQMFEREK